MGTEVAISFTALRAQLETERSSLYKIDENIKKIVQTTGRFSNDRFNNSSGDYIKGGPRLGGRNSYPDSRQNDDSFGKRKQETKTVFSRLSARTVDSDGEEEAGGGGGGGGKRARVESAVTRELPSRAAVLRAQGGDEQARTRNRRIFGSLLGTLQKFKQEEIVLQTKEDKKAQVERKIEEQARLQKEKEQKERKTLFAEREHKKATIKALEAKMARVHEFEKWEASQKNLANFILTRSKPHIYWIPKKMTDKATEKLMSSRKYHEKCMVKKRAELQEELLRIEQRCLRLRGPQAKENHPAPRAERPPDDDGARKRDKFAVDADKKDDSDGDDHDRRDEHRDDHRDGHRDDDHREDHRGDDHPDDHRGDDPRNEHRDDDLRDDAPDDAGEARDDTRDTRGDAAAPEGEPVTDESKIEVSEEQNTNVEGETKDTSQISLEASEPEQPADNPPEPAEQS